MQPECFEIPLTSHINFEIKHVYRAIFSGGTMEALTSVISGVNWEAIAQLTLVSLIMISGPIVIFVLAARGGDL